MKRKKRLIAIIVVIAVVVMAALAFIGHNIYRYPAMFRNLSDNSLNDSQVEEVREEILSRPEIKVLVAYFSYSGTTRNVANAISEKTGGDLFEITPQNGYSNVYMESNSEIRRNERPALTDTVENMEEYDIVFVGYPVWWHATPAPINTFLESYDLTGKLIIPFCTSGGSDIDETMPTFLNSCDGLAVYGERRISGTSGLDNWLSELGLTGTAAVIQEAAWETVPEGVESASPVQEMALREIPDDYLQAAQQQGTVVRMDYQTNTYDEQNESLSKYAFVYLPYGYEESDTQTRYNVFYLMHGGGGTAERYLGGENGDAPLKRILDHMIENGDIEPMIVVTPTFYHNNSSGPEAELTANFHNELVQDLMPAVESTYHTYAESTDHEGLTASREHRIFGGFSMGSVTTWYTFIDGLDYFKYYLPISGDCWLYGRMGGSDEGYLETAAYLNQVVQDSGYLPDDYYIYAATGTADIAYEALSGQVEAMRAYPETFIYNQDFTKGNFYYGVVEGGVHNNTYMNQYIYNALPAFGI